jgi:hypothetical protein
MYAIGTVSGSTISFGSPNEFFSSVNEVDDIELQDIANATYDNATGKTVVFFTVLESGSSGRAMAIVGGTSFSENDAVFITADDSSKDGFETDRDFFYAASDTNGKVLFVFAEEGFTADDIRFYRVGTINGNSLDLGVLTEVDRSSASGVYVIYDPNSDKMVVKYSYNDIRVGTISGDSVSFGSPVTPPSFEIAVYDSVERKLVFIGSGGDTEIRAFTGEVSGDSINFGPVTQYSVAGIGDIRAAYLSGARKILICAVGDDPEYLLGYYLAEVDGDTVNFISGPTVFNSDAYAPNIGEVVYDPLAERAVVTYRVRDAGSSNDLDQGEAIVLTPDYTQTNVDKFIGFAGDSASVGETVLVATDQQIDANQTGLTPKTTYYVDVDGTITTSDTGLPVAGFALDSNTIQVGE